MTNTDKQCSSCGGDCGKVCERGNVVEPYNGWVLRNVYFEDGEPLMHSEPESQALVEPPNSATDVVEPEEPLCYLQEIDTLGGAYEQVAWGEGFPVYTAPQNMEVEIKRLQEREWVGLTDEEIAQAVGSPLDEVYLADFRKVEARLRSKNGY